MHSLNLAMEENSIKWTTIAGEILAINQLLLEISIENVLTDSKLVCSMIEIYIDYENPIEGVRAKFEGTSYASL